MDLKRWVPVFLLIQTVLTWVVLTLHLSSIRPPREIENLALLENLRIEKHGRWLERRENGIHQLVLEGTAFERGWASGKLTKNLMVEEERELFSHYTKFFPQAWTRLFLQLALTRWFTGIDQFVWNEHLEEMHGVSLSTDTEFDIYLPPYARQVAYHGIHEVGQMMVDQRSDDQGCTVLAVPLRTGWILGRTFDFEGGRIFDEEKIMKWVFPQDGIPYLSVIWAGMVGVVSGVNANGLYISINAAGTREFRRHGTVTTLLVAEALQRFSTARQAVDFLKSSTSFISDIFIVADRHELYRVEKSPQATEIIPLRGPSVVTNHFISKRWASDKTNLFRKFELTSRSREARGAFLVGSMAPNVNGVLAGLRDKTDVDGKPLDIGNRRAIDALIATHGVIYNSFDQSFYVSQGPGLSGVWRGFDLNRSFAERTPVALDSLPADRRVSKETFVRVRNSERQLLHIKEQMRSGDCNIELSQVEWKQSSLFSEISGDLAHCRGDYVAARGFWQMALDRRPAYAREMRELEEKLRRNDVKNLQFK